MLLPLSTGTNPAGGKENPRQHRPALHLGSAFQTDPEVCLCTVSSHGGQASSAGAYDASPRACLPCPGLLSSFPPCHPQLQEQGCATISTLQFLKAKAYSDSPLKRPGVYKEHIPGAAKDGNLGLQFQCYLVVPAGATVPTATLIEHVLQAPGWSHS